MSKLKLGDSERELLVFFARREDATVREASDHFLRERGWARTTVLKTVDRLTTKGLLKRAEVDGIFRYRSTISESDLQERLVAQLVEGALGGSLTPFVAYLDGQSHVSSKDLDALKELVRKLEDRNR